MANLHKFLMCIKMSTYGIKMTVAQYKLSHLPLYPALWQYPRLRLLSTLFL